MKPRELLDFMYFIDDLKTTTRHCYTAENRLESVADHSWSAALLAMLCKDAFPNLDMNKVIKMCLIHDFGEAVTGDIPAFYKTDEQEETEDKAIARLLKRLPEKQEKELAALFEEMEKLETPEAKLYKAIDKMEGVLAHNESDISTWIPLEYELNLTYGEESVGWSEWTKELREELRKDTIKKLEANK